MTYNVFNTRACLFVTKCDVDLKWYPFDSNTCRYKFMPWSDSWLDMHVADNYLESRISLPEFKVTIGDATVEITKTYEYPQVTIPFRISRNGNYYSINYICPILLLVVLTWVSFFIPQAMSDRVAYTMTLLLTLM